MSNTLHSILETVLLNVERYPGTAGHELIRDSWYHLNGIKWSTKNNDNDSMCYIVERYWCL